jgi:hypothetical protein
MPWLIGFCIILGAFQCLAGTNLEFAEWTFLSIVLAGLAINLLGGLKTIAGCCVALIALKFLVIAQIAKVLLWEPGQYRLQQPLETGAVLTLGMAALVCAAWVTQLVPWKKSIFSPAVDPEFLRILSMTGFIVGLGAMVGSQWLGVREDGAIQMGGIPGILRRISLCVPIAIVAGTAHQIIQTQGRRIIGWYNGIPICAMFVLGNIMTSKQMAFEPFFFLILTGIAFHYSWQRKHLAWFVILLGLAVFVLIPFSQIARNYTRGAGMEETISKTIKFIHETYDSPGSIMRQYRDSVEKVEDDNDNLYYDRPIGWLERFSLIKPADSLVAATLKKGPSGWTTITPGIIGLIPRVLYPRSMQVNTPNYLGFKADILDEENLGTSIAFGFMADAFSAFGWLGAGMIPFLIGGLLFLISRLLVTTIERNIWGVFFLGAYQHVIAEANIEGVIGLIVYQTAWYLATCFVLILFANTWLQFKGRGVSSWKPWKSIAIRQ